MPKFVGVSLKTVAGRADSTGGAAAGTGVGEVTMAVTNGVVDITAPPFARRFGTLIRERRLATGDSIRSIARGSAGELTVRMLRDIEDALVPLDHGLVSLVASCYGADLAAILPERLSIAISDDGVIRSGPAERHFLPGDEVALLTAYLELVRSMRRQNDSTIVLRRDDIDVLAEHVRQPGSVVVERLLAVMGTSRTQRSAVLALFATGAMVIGLASSAAAGGTDDTTPAVTRGTVESVAPGHAAVALTTDPIDPTDLTDPTGPATARGLAEQRDEVATVLGPAVGPATLRPSTRSTPTAEQQPVPTTTTLPPQHGTAEALAPIDDGGTLDSGTLDGGTVDGGTLDTIAPPPPPAVTFPPIAPYEPPPDQDSGEAPVPSLP